MPWSSVSWLRSASCTIALAVLPASVPPAESPPPREPGQGLLQISPEPSSIGPGDRFEVSATESDAHFELPTIPTDDGGIFPTSWEKWNGDSWIHTHRLISRASSRDGDEQLEVPFVEPVEGTEWVAASALAVSGPLRFVAPETGPGIYRVCFNLNGSRGFQGACFQLRFAGDGVPALNK